MIKDKLSQVVITLILVIFAVGYTSQNALAAPSTNVINTVPGPIVPPVTPPITPPVNPPVVTDDQPNSGILDTILNLPEKIFTKFLEGVAEAFKNYFDKKIEETILEIKFMLTGFKNILTNDSINDKIFSFSKSLAYGLKPVAYSFIALFFVMEFCKKTMYFEVMNYLNVVKPLLKMMLTKYFVDNSIYILGLILDITRGITNKVFTYINTTNLNTVMDYKAINNQSALQSIGNTTFNLSLWFFGNLIFLLFCAGLIVICYVMANMRLIELAFLCAISPLFFSTLAGDVTNDVFRGFIKNFVSVAFQSVWMAVGLGFFATGYVQGITGGASLSVIPNMIIGLLTLTAYIVKAPGSVKSALGGTGGGNMNLTSIIQLAATIL